MSVTRWIGASVVAAYLVGCGAPANTDEQNVTAQSDALRRSPGAELFDHATFGGNGRTCATCHLELTSGTTSPIVAQIRHIINPNDPLFRSIDSDDGVGNKYTRLLTDATIRITLPLPPFLAMADQPGATSVTYNRGIPTVFNIGLDPVLMSDGREPTLQSQAADALHDHAQNTVAPTASQLDAIATYEKTLFTSEALARYAAGGPPPALPAGRTASEKRGRTFFEANGLCGQCHFGPMLNTTSPAFPVPNSRFAGVFVSELNEGNQPVHHYVATLPDGTQQAFDGTDLGRFLVTYDPGDLNLFKIPQLWGVKNTAPYFHDNSAKTLREVMVHYAETFQITGQGTLSAQDQADIIAFLELL